MAEKPCATCLTLKEELASAERAGDRSRALDCVVLLRRHPDHGASPVAAPPESRPQWYIEGYG
ncbi:hypothetical protein ACFY7Z_15945 [Streptomyces sp. NPDC012623]|uniref:hypothetical protein n=1 Tax=unclassified Streptomyces TaxID=2593676 RepID=UPI0036C7A9F2